MKVSDYIAQFLAARNARHIFAISGAGNVHLLDSFDRQPELQYVCPHHEQAGVMAAIAYARLCDSPGIMCTTGGPGAINAVTGVLDAWADSMPCIIISGQEKTQYASRENPLRMWGVQGTDIAGMVSSITKYSAMVRDPKEIRWELEKVFHEATTGRPGPVWLDIPTDVQAAQVEPSELRGFEPEPAHPAPAAEMLDAILDQLKKAERPLLWLGHGIRLAGGVGLVPTLLERLQVPLLTAWNGMDMVPTGHPLHFGHAGTYGQRCANFVVQNCDFLLTVGTRLAIPQVGYEWEEFAREANKVVVDIDATELGKFPTTDDWQTVQADARVFLDALLERAESVSAPPAWVERCQSWREKYPIVDEVLHPQEPGQVNSYAFIEKLSGHFADDEFIVTDMGTALTSTHQAIVLREGQRLVTSTGLGEMGYGLPGAIGAAFARLEKPVTLIIGDGSIMMNLQEMQTVVHHKLPIKMFLYTNDGYLTIKHTQIGLFKDRFAGSGGASGVTCPDFIKVAEAFGWKTFKISGHEDIDEVVPQVYAADGPVLCEVVMPPLQPLVPKLSFAIQPDGKLVSPPLEDLYPFLPRQELAEQMIIEVHPRSLQIDVPVPVAREEVSPE